MRSISAVIVVVAPRLSPYPQHQGDDHHSSSRVCAASGRRPSQLVAPMRSIRATTITARRAYAQHQGDDHHR
jgi:hypothetical protein